MKYFRLAVALMVATIVVAPAFGASLSVSAQHLASGTQVVAKCDPTPVWAFGSYTKNAAGQVTGLTVSNIASGCNGGKLSITLSNAPSVSSGGPTTITSCPTTCSVVMTVSPPLYPSQITSAVAVIAGP